MAYVSKEDKKTLAPAIKKVLAEYGVKGTIKVCHHSTLVVTIRKVPAGLFTPKEIANGDVNVYHIDTFFEGTAKKFLTKLLAAMKGDKWFDKSDSMIDYFHTAWYNDIKIGGWDKPVEIL
tara:strand:+ start:255 stop:614 length:360 start_codon:yes stop_codon:yes gene_type:complete